MLTGSTPRIYSLILTCRAIEVNPEEYFTDILGRVDKATPAQLTPWAWKRERATPSAGHPRPG